MFNSEEKPEWRNSTPSESQGDKCTTNTYAYNQNNNLNQSQYTNQINKSCIESEVENVFYEECMKLNKDDFKSILSTSGQFCSK